MLFQIYGENAMYQLLGWVMVFAGLVICNEIARRSKAGGILLPLQWELLPEQNGPLIIRLISTWADGSIMRSCMQQQPVVWAL